MSELLLQNPGNDGVPISAHQGFASCGLPIDILGETYTILELLSQRSTSTTLKVLHKRLKKIFVAKVLHGNDSPDNQGMVWIERAARDACALNHAQLAAIYDVGRVQSDNASFANRAMPYLVMQWIEGESLRSFRKRRETLAFDDVLDIFIQIVEVLMYAHGEGFIHGDLRPSKILLQAVKGRFNVRIIDCRMTPALIAANQSNKGKTLGPRINRHLRYKSPEQCLGLIFDARADIFTVGSIMYEMMNYKPPATTSGISNILWKQLGLPPEPSRMAGIDCPAGMREAIMHCLEKSVHNRYQSMEALRTDLELLRQGKRPRLGCRLALRNPFSKI